jgi:hypothetical protein
MFKRLGIKYVLKALTFSLILLFSIISFDGAKLYWNYYNSYETCSAHQHGKDFCNRRLSNSGNNETNHKPCSFCQCNDAAEFVQSSPKLFPGVQSFNTYLLNYDLVNRKNSLYSLFSFNELAPPS